MAIWTRITDPWCSFWAGGRYSLSPVHMLSKGVFAISILESFEDKAGSSPGQPGLTPELNCFEKEVGQGPLEVTSSLTYPVTLCYRNGTFYMHQSANIICH